ncbi:MAG: class I SAM-dependent methyltransferase, partial [Clostridia bacterium]|nr:class I SAM-dependent methyltransferase [Clostridia bacterium]
MKYELLAEIYDRFADDFDYDAWAKWYWRLISSVKPEIRSIADVGCGTGPLAVRFAKRGIKVTGIDLSEDMLRVASDKARKWGVQVRLACQDMRNLSLPSRADALISACDGVNYLLTDEDVSLFFEAAFRALRPGGAFAFDVSNHEKLLGFGKTYLFAEEREEGAYIWTNEFDEETRICTMNTVFFIKEEDGRYKRFEEMHEQKAHSAVTLKMLLE